MFALVILLAIFVASTSAQSSVVPSVFNLIFLAVGLVAYLAFLRAASWFSGRRLQHFLIESVVLSKPAQQVEPVGYAATIRALEDDISPR